MNIPIVIANADCLLAERTREDIPSIHKTNKPGEDTDVVAWTVVVGGCGVTTTQFVKHLQFMQVESYESGLLMDICETLFVTSLVAAYILADGKGYVFHCLKKNSDGLWDTHTTKGGPESMMALGKDGSVVYFPYAPTTPDGRLETIQMYRDLSEQGVPLSGFFDVYVGKSGELNQNVSI